MNSLIPYKQRADAFDRVETKALEHTVKQRATR